MRDDENISTAADNICATDDSDEYIHAQKTHTDDVQADGRDDVTDVQLDGSDDITNVQVEDTDGVTGYTGTIINVETITEVHRQPEAPEATETPETSGSTDDRPDHQTIHDVHKPDGISEEVGETSKQYVNESDTDARSTPPPAYVDVIKGFPEVTSDVNPTSVDKWYTVDTRMLPCKLTYFFDQLKEASLWPFLVLFQVSIGLSMGQAGIINGARFVGCLIGAPLWGMIADQKRIHRPLVMAICAAAMVFQCSQPFWGKQFGPEKQNVCPRATNETLKQEEAEQKTGHVHNDKLFTALLVISVIACFFDGTTLTFVDSGVQRKIKASGKVVDFGRQRLFGSIGYGTGSMLSSMALEYFPHVGISCYAGIFCVYCFATISLIINFNFLYKGANVKPDDSEKVGNSRHDTNANPAVRKLIWQTVKKFDSIFFLVTVLFNGLLRALVFSFTYLYLKEIGAPDWMLGLSMVVSQVASMIMYALAEKIIDLCGGTMEVMCLSCFSWIIRLIGLAYMENYYIILPLNALNGVSASLFVAASIIHVRKSCPPAAFTTMYGIRNSLFNGGGYIIANVVGGELYQFYGPQRLFKASCGFCAGWVAIMIIYISVQRYKTREEARKQQAKENICLECPKTNNIAEVA